METTNEKRSRKLGLYATIKREADKIGWPTNYREDLTEHDKKTARTVKNHEIAFWLLRELGTHLYIVRTAGVIDWIDAVADQHASDGRFYIWRNGKLENCDAKRWKAEARLIHEQLPQWRIEATDGGYRPDFEFLTVKADTRETAVEMAKLKLKQKRKENYKIPYCEKIISAD